MPQVGPPGEERMSQFDVSSPSWASFMEGAVGTDVYSDMVQDDFPAGSPAGGCSWASMADDFPEAGGPSDSMLRDPSAIDTVNNNRDHDSWHESFGKRLYSLKAILSDGTSWSPLTSDPAS